MAVSLPFSPYCQALGLKKFVSASWDRGLFPSGVTLLSPEQVPSLGFSLAPTVLALWNVLCSASTPSRLPSIPFLHIHIYISICPWKRQKLMSNL